MTNLTRHFLGSTPSKTGQIEYDTRPMPRGFRKTRGGFTLIELLVAAMIVSIALLGVFSLMRQASQVEARSQKVWQSRGQAEAVADHLMNALKRAVAVPPSEASAPEGQEGGGSSDSAIQAGPGPDGTFRLRCFVLGGVYDHGCDEPVGGTRWLEYRWFRDSQADGINTGLVSQGLTDTPEQTSGYRVELRSVLLAGGSLLYVEPSSSNNSTAVDWDRIEPVTLAMGIDEIDIAFQPLPDGNWRAAYEGPPNEVLIRLRVRVSDESVERVFYARSAADPSSNGGGQPDPGAEGGGP